MEKKGKTQRDINISSKVKDSLPSRCLANSYRKREAFPYQRQKPSPVGNQEETGHHPKCSGWAQGSYVGHPNVEPRHHECLGWEQAPHGSSRTWDTEDTCFLLYHIHLFSINSQSKSFLLGLKLENDWAWAERKAPGKMGF